MSEPPSASAKTILVADDEASMRKIIERRLLSWGYRVVVAVNGTEAVRLAKERRPDLILLDVMMPGLNGLEVCRQMKQDAATAPIPIVIVTAKESRTIRDEAAAAGANGFIQKPYEFSELLRHIQTALGEGPAVAV